MKLVLFGKNSYFHLMLTYNTFHFLFPLQHWPPRRLTLQHYTRVDQVGNCVYFYLVHVSPTELASKHQNTSHPRTWKEQQRRESIWNGRVAASSCWCEECNEKVLHGKHILCFQGRPKHSTGVSVACLTQEATIPGLCSLVGLGDWVAENSSMDAVGNARCKYHGISKLSGT